MDLGEALIARAGADAGVAAIFADRIHIVQRPQGEGFPALVLQVVSEQRPQTLDGFDDMRTARVQADSFALEKAKGGGGYAEACAGIEAAIAALLPAAEIGNVAFWDGSVEGPRDLGEQTDTGFVHRRSADLILRYGIIA